MTKLLGSILAFLIAMALPPGLVIAQAHHTQEELSDEVVGALEAGRAMPGEFGGLWLDDMTVVVAFTEDATSNDIERVTDKIPEWASFRLVLVTYSEAQLVDTYDDVTADMVKHEIRYVVGVGVALPDNLVEISVLPNRLGEEELLRESYGQVRLRFVASEPDEGAACTRYDCWNASLKAGISVDGCTTGGIVFADNGGGSFTFRLLTAGHCSMTGSAWTHDGHSIGTTTSTRYLNNSECDCQFISIPAGWDGHKYLQNNNDIENFMYRKQRANMLVGTEVCQSGKMAANRRCGTLSQVNYSSYRPADDLTLKKQAVATYAIDHGDSGGPVTSESGEVAWGINSGIQGDGDAIFSPIQATEFEWNDVKLCVSEDSVTEC